MRYVSNCRVAVVGGAGFLGSHLVDALVERNCDVLVVDNLVVGRREYVHPKAEFQHQDITLSEERLRRLFTGCKFVFNYAAYPYIPVSFARPKLVAEVNFMGAIGVINAAAECGTVEAILQVSSAEIYGGGGPFVSKMLGGSSVEGKITETAPVCPHSSYGVAKAAVDYYVQCAWKERKTPCIALRQFNCIGERETHPYVVPEIISQLTKQQRVYSNIIAGDNEEGIVKLGNNSFRDFLYAGDAVNAAIRLVERGQFGEVYNLGSEKGVQIYDLAEQIGLLMGFREVIVHTDEQRVRPWEIWHLQSNNTKIQSVIGNAVTVPFEQALVKTIAWFENNGRKWPWER